MFKPDLEKAVIKLPTSIGSSKKQESSRKISAAKSLQLCPTLRDPIDGSPPGSAIPRILQAITLEWVAISFSNAWKWKVKVKSLSRVWLFATPWTIAYQAPPSMGFSRQSTSALLIMPKPLTMWTTTNSGEFWKRWEYQTPWPASWEICMQVKKQHLELEMGQQFGSKLGKEYLKAVYCHPAHLTSMQSTSWETLVEEEAQA